MGRMFLCLCILGLLLSAVAGPSLAGHYSLAFWRMAGDQEGHGIATMAVHVFNEFGEPVPGAVVHFNGPLRDLTVTTDYRGYAEGGFQFSGSPAIVYCTDVSGSTTDVTPQLYNHDAHRFYEIGFMYRTSASNPGTFDVTWWGDLNSITHCPSTKSLTFNTPNPLDYYSDTRVLGSSGCWELGNTFVATADRVVALRCHLTKGAYSRFRWAAQIFEGGPNGPPIGPRKILPNEYIEGDNKYLLNYALDECALKVGNTYYVGFSTADGTDVNAWECVNNVYANGVLYENQSPVTSRDLQAWVCAMSSGDSNVGTITGTVRGPDGQPIREATITLSPGAKTAKTGKLGTYKCYNVSPGTYTLTASAPGYSPQAITGRVVTAGNTLTTDFNLSRDPGPISVRTITVPGGSIDPGQQAVPISMTIENTALGDVFVESVGLSFWQGSTDVSNYFTVTPNPSNPSVIRGNQTAVFNFTVDVSSSAPLGPTTVHGSAKGILNLKANGSFEKDASIPEGTGPTDWEWLAGYPADDYYMSYQHQQSYGNVAPIPDTATKLTFRWIAAWSSTGTDNKKQGFKLYMKNPAGGGWKLRMEIHCMSSRLYFQLAKGTPSVPGWLYYFTPLQYYQIDAWLRASDGHFEVTITPIGGSGTVGFCSGTAAPESDTPTVQWGNMYASGTNEMWAKEASYAVEENGIPPQGWTVSWSAFDGRVPDDPSLPTSKRWNLEDGQYGPPYEQIVASAPWYPPSHFAVEQVDVKEGTRALKLWYAPNQSNPEGYVSTGSGTLLPRISVLPGTTYTASFWYKIVSYGLSTANYRLRMLWEEYDSAGRPYFRRGTDPFFHDAEPVPVVTDSWQKVTYTFTTTQWTTSCMAYLDLIKVGDGGGGLVIYFDDFRLYNANGYVDTDADTPGTLTIGSAQPVSSVQEAKALGDGVVISLSQAIVTGRPIGEPTVFNIESDDRESGIRVVKSGHGMDVGMRANIIGTLRTSADGERYIEATSVTAAGTGTVDPLMLPNRELGGGSWAYNPATGAGQKGVKDAVGLNNIGLLVTITGRVTYRGVGYFYVDDGSAIADPSGHLGVKVISTGLDAPQSDYVKVTGFSSCYKLGSDLYRLIRVRGAADIVEYAE